MISNEMVIHLRMVLEHVQLNFEMIFVMLCVFEGNLVSCKFDMVDVKERYPLIQN